MATTRFPCMLEPHWSSPKRNPVMDEQSQWQKKSLVQVAKLSSVEITLAPRSNSSYLCDLAAFQQGQVRRVPVVIHRRQQECCFPTGTSSCVPNTLCTRSAKP